MESLSFRWPCCTLSLDLVEFHRHIASHFTMPITILNPRPSAPRRPAVADVGSDSDSESDGGADIQGDVSMRAPKRRRASRDDEGLDILTPGSIITSNPQWMR